MSARSPTNRFGKWSRARRASKGLFWEMVLPPPDSSNFEAWCTWYEEGGLDTTRNPPPYMHGGPPPLIFPERAPSVRRPRHAPNPNAMTHEQAQAIAESEGLKLMMSNANTTGYLYVHPSGSHFHATLYKDGKKQPLDGSWCSAAEAALAVARELGPQGIEMSLARNAPEPPSMSIEEVKAAVEAEGLTLITDDSATGFLGVGPMLRATAKKSFAPTLGRTTTSISARLPPLRRRRWRMHGNSVRRGSRPTWTRCSRRRRR